VPEPLLQTKLNIPPTRSDYVQRGRLSGLLAAGQQSKVTLVCAPAGYGKTTLLASWATARGLPVAWLSLDAGDNDPGQFLVYLITAFQAITPQAGTVSLPMLQATPPTPLNTVLITLANELSAVADDLFLVLDDYQAIESRQVHEALSFLIDKMPGQVHIILASRSDPPLPLGRLRARGQLSELRQSDLRFTAGEAEAFFKQNGRPDLTAGQINALSLRTEGWVAGLQLAALSLPGQTELAPFIEEFGGSHRYVIDFLAEEVLSQQPEPLVHFLVQTSILDRLNGSLCDAVIQDQGSGSILKELEEKNLFLLPLDEHRQWYRYQPLFRDFLRTHLEDEARTRLHARAAAWFLTHELPSEAVNHARASDDVTLLVNTITRVAPAAFNRGSHSALLGWLNYVPEQQLLANSDLAIYKGFALLLTQSFEVALPYANAAEMALTPETSPSTRGRLLSLQANIALCQDQVEACIRLSREALALLAEDDHLFRNLTNNALGQFLELKGDVAAAAGIYEQAFRSGWQRGDQMGALVIFSNLVFALNELGRRREALALCKQMESRGHGESFRQLPLLEAVNLPKSLLTFEGNHLEDALEQVNRAMALLTAANFSQGIIWGKFIQARIYLAQNDLEAMFKTTREGYNVAAQVGHESIHGAWLVALEAQAWLQQGNLPRVIQWAESTGFSAQDSPAYWLEYPYFTYIRLLIAQNRLAEASLLLQTIGETANQAGRIRKLISVRLLQAACHLDQANLDEAQELVKQAVELAQSGGYRRAFLDEGPPITRLLPAVREVAPAFVDAILAAHTSPEDSPVSDGGLIDPLSQRELEVLGHVAAGHSNREIAVMLVVTVGTVKKHLNNIFSKMGVRSRTQAVAQAREIGLLD